MNHNVERIMITPIQNQGVQNLENISFVINVFPSKKSLNSKIIKKRRCYKIVDEELIEAVNSNDYYNLEYLYKIGYNVYANDDYILQLSVKKGYYKIVEFLLKNGSKPNCNNYICFDLAHENHDQKIYNLLVKYYTYHRDFQKSTTQDEIYHISQYGKLFSKLNYSNNKKLNF